MANIKIEIYFSSYGDDLKLATGFALKSWTDSKNPAIRLYFVLSNLYEFSFRFSFFSFLWSCSLNYCNLWLNSPWNLNCKLHKKISNQSILLLILGLVIRDPILLGLFLLVHLVVCLQPLIKVLETIIHAVIFEVHIDFDFFLVDNFIKKPKFHFFFLEILGFLLMEKDLMGMSPLFPHFIFIHGYFLQ